MFEWLRRYFTRVQYKLVEVNKVRTQLRWDRDTKDAVATLNAHPGFVALTDRLGLQRELLQSKMNQEFHKELREIDVLQAGIFWCGWLQREVEKATSKGPSRTIEATDEEMEAFRAIDSQIERIGME